ncbi:hypothetical protein B0T21DRAFT_414485 [Apiosordaria backusii]|uniref:Uncharacterized protein n=1 Tax=Apiosordaria backusii TaxID=314023 RepID=A0AA40ASP2_9PEZI|nr:hypothetical protein B0T21DRAFT_414485 [Apiosordaria backusii]
MAISLPHQRPASPPNSKTHQALLTSLTPLSLSLSQTHLSLPLEATLFSLLTTSFTSISKIFSLPTSATLSLDQLLESIFPSETLPIILDTTSTLLSGLPDQDKATLYIQAIAGTVLIFQHLSKHEEITTAILDRELRLFEQSEEKTEVLGKMEESGLLRECYTKQAVVDFLVSIIEDAQQKDEQEAEEVTGSETETVFTNEKVDWDMEGGRPYGNMGLPWGFTIMALN